MKKHTLIFTILTLILLRTISIQATSFEGDQNVTISTEVNEDLYIAGGNILITAPIRGDLICAAGDVTIQDTVTEDILLVGGTLKLMGYIGDDLRVAGGTILITNYVEGDLIVAGGEVTVGKDAVINGNLNVVGGKLTMNGTIKGEANLKGGEIYWNGIAERELSVKGGSLEFNGTVRGKSQLAAQSIILGSDAKFYGDVEFWNTAGSLDFGNSLTNGATSRYNKDLNVAGDEFDWRYMGVGIVAFWVYRLLAAALILVLLIWMFHHFLTSIGTEAIHNFVNNLGFGLLYVIGLPLIIILAFVTIIGIPVGLILMTFYGMTIALGHILASLLMSYGFNVYYEKNWNRQILFLGSIGSYLLLKFVSIIPFIGFVVSLFIVTTAFGTILYIWWVSRKSDVKVIEE